MRIETKAELDDLWARLGAGLPVTREEMIVGARFLLEISAPRRASKARAEGDLEDAIQLLRRAGVEIPIDITVGAPFQRVARAADWSRSLGAKVSG